MNGDGRVSTIRMARHILPLMAFAAFPAPSQAFDGDDLQDLLADARSLRTVVGQIDSLPRSRGGAGGFMTYRDPIRIASLRYDVPAPLIAAVIQCESNWNPHARSSAGARGLMQVLPRTALAIFGVGHTGLWDPVTNINIGTAYLRVLANRYKGNGSSVIAAYNAGPTRFDRSRPLPRETRRYRACVRRWHAAYARLPR